MTPHKELDPDQIALHQLATIELPSADAAIADRLSTIPLSKRQELVYGPPSWRSRFETRVSGDEFLIPPPYIVERAVTILDRVIGGFGASLVLFRAVDALEVGSSQDLWSARKAGEKAPDRGDCDAAWNEHLDRVASAKELVESAKKVLEWATREDHSAREFAASWIEAHRQNLLDPDLAPFRHQLREPDPAAVCERPASHLRASQQLHAALEENLRAVELDEPFFFMTAKRGEYRAYVWGTVDRILAANGFSIGDLAELCTALGLFCPRFLETYPDTELSASGTTTRLREILSEVRSEARKRLRRSTGTSE